MASDYDNLPTGTKYLKLAVGLLPPLATWYITGSIWYAAAVFLIGFIVGYVISDKYTGYAFRSAGEMPRARFIPKTSEGLWRNLYQFSFGRLVCGTIAAAVFIWLSKST